MTHNSLVLISSYRDAEKIATIIAEQRKDVEVLRAREDEPMSATVGKYKALKSPKCLVGTMQYFTGLDLKGDQLSELFIAKAPFKTPKNNTGAKKYKGMSFTLTESYENQTMMQFLQGFGRPIRDYEDTAITYILDTRIFSKKRPYYKRFMDEKSIQVSFAEAICAKGDLLGMKTAGSESLYAFFHPYFAGRAFDDLSGTLGICGSGEKEKEVFCRISRKMLKEGYTVDRLIGKESFDLMLASEKYDFVLLLFEAYRQMQIKKRLPDPIVAAVGIEGFKESPRSILLSFLANN